MSAAQRRYWTECEHIRHQFFKILSRDFPNQMEIPTKFVLNFQEKLPDTDTISLKGPSGDVWPVTLRRGVGGRWVLEGGWSDFIRDHGLTEPHFLVFRYEGNHVFHVTIFNSKSACEKEDCYFIKNQNAAQQRYWTAQRRDWTECEPIRHQFFKILSKDFENQMKIPTKFALNFQEELPDTISLKGPSGDVWQVTLRRGDGPWVLEGGWSDFVRDHGLTEHHFLVFRYEGNHVFHVSIFSKSACEKEDCYFIKNQTPTAEKGKRKLKAGESSRGPGEYSRDPTDCSLNKKYSMYLVSQRRSASKEEKCRAREMADAHAQSSNLPSFTKVMTPTQVCYHFTVNFPTDWGRKLIPKVNNMEVELSIPQLEEKWHVTLKNNKWKYGFAKGWYKFVLDNNLEEDDVCVFELNQSGKNRNGEQTIIFDVYIFRVVAEVVPLTAVSAI